MITGTSGNDVLLGSLLSDVIKGLASDDIISAGDAGDNIDGGAGNDSIRGASGNDYLAGGSGNDTILGGFGDDYVNGVADDDLRVTGGDGNDTVLGGAGNDSILGATGNDYLYGGDGDDTLFGGTGDDILYGVDGNDLLVGSPGIDNIYGGIGSDTIRISFKPGEGPDSIYNFDPSLDCIDIAQVSGTNTLSFDSSNGELQYNGLMIAVIVHPTVSALTSFDPTTTSSLPTTLGGINFVYNRAIKYANKSGYKQVKAKALTGLGELHRIQGDFAKAIPLHRKSIALLDEILAKCDLAEAYFQFALTYQAMGDTANSQKNFDAALQLFREIDAPRQIERVQQAMIGGV